MPTAHELNIAYGLIDPDEDELEGIGTEGERSEALIGASLPSITPPSLDTESFLAPPEETTPIVPTGLARTPSIPRAEARIQPIAQPTQARGPIFRTAEAILSPAEQLNREYGLAPTIPSEGIIPREITRPESPATRLNREMGLTPSTRPIGETGDTQEPGTPVSTIFRDLMVPVEPTPPPPLKKPGLIGEALRGIPHGILQVGEIAGGLVGLAGEATGIEAIERVGAQLHKTFQEMNQRFAPTVAGFQDIESVGDAARYLGHGFMSMLPFMVGTFGVGAAIRGVVTKTLGKAITERAAAKAIIGFSSLAAASTIAETGIIAGERVDEGMKALSLNLLWAIPAGLMDALPGWRLMGKLGWFGRAVTKRAEREGLRAARHYFIKEVGKQAFFEGVTESTQEIFEALGAGKKPFSYETLMQAANAFIIAGFTGGVLGGAASLLGPSPQKRAAPPPDIAPPVAPPDITRDPTDILKPAVTKPDVAGLWQETVLPTVAEEPILMDEISRIWRNFLKGTPIWTDLNVKDGQAIITGVRGEQLSLNFNEKKPAGEEFELEGYTDKNGVFTKLDPNVLLPQSLRDAITDGLALEGPIVEKEARGAGVTAAPTPPGAGLVPAATPFIEGAPTDILHKEVVEPAPEPVKEVSPEPLVPPGLPKGFFEAVIMFDEQGAVSVRPISYESIREGVENLPGFLGKVYLDAKKDTVYTPEMMVARSAGETVDGIARSKVEALKGEGFRPAFQELLPGERFQAREEVAARPVVPPFYHLSEVIINSKMTGPMSSTQILKMLQNAGVKQDELVWTGLDDLLKQPKRFTKQEVLDFIKQNEVRVEEVLKAGEPGIPRLGITMAGFIEYAEKYDKSRDEAIKIWRNEGSTNALYQEWLDTIEQPTKFAQWQFPGGENYRELLMTLPVKRPSFDEWLTGQGKDKTTLLPNVIQDYKKIYEQAFSISLGVTSQYQYKSTHYDEPNILAHVRFNERIDAEGKQVLFIEEVQSDWHQAGRERGYQVRIDIEKICQERDALLSDQLLSELKVIDPERAGQVEALERQMYDINRGTGIPPAPFSKTWHELMMKRMVRWAAENRFDKVAWTTGEQQAERYNQLLKNITSVEYYPYPTTDAWDITVITKDGRILLEGMMRSGELKRKLGANVSRDILSDSGNSIRGGTRKELSYPDGITIGGEFLKLLYDTKIPSYMNTFGKKWGVKVGETAIKTKTEQWWDIYRPGEEKPISGPWVELEQAKNVMKPGEILKPYGQEKVHSLDITPSMKESVLFEGQPLFREAMQEMEGQPMSVMAVQKIIDTFQVQLPKDVLSYEVPSSVDELPADIQKRNKVTGKTQALYDRVLNKIYVIADRHTSEQDVLTSICHELFGHFGFERLFGPARMNEIVQEVHKFYGKEGLAYLYQAYNKIPGSPDGDYTVAIEKIAEFAGTGENPGLWKRFVYWFRYHATKLFGPIRFSEDDIRAYLWRSRILIQQQSFQDQVRKYNAFVKLTGAKMWDNGLPIGPLGARFAMREDTSPSHESAAENFTGWRGWYEAYSNKDKNFGNEIFKRLGLVESVASLPHWIGMNHPSFKPVTQVQWDRMDEKNRDRLYLLQDPSTNQGNNPYMSVDLLKDTSGVDPLVVWSDRNDIYLENDENLQRKAMELIRRNLTPVEIKAYRGWKDGFDRAVGYAIARLRQLSVDFYSSTKWFDQLRGVLDGSLQVDQVQLEGSDAKDFQRALKKVAERMQTIDEQEAALKRLNFYAPHVRGRGDHIVRVYDIDPEGKDVAIWVERFDSATQAERARMRLGGQYRNLRVVKTLEKQTSEFIYGGLNVYAMEAFLKKSAERAVKEEKINEAEADILLNAVFKSMNDEIMARGFRQHYIRRQQGNIGGYREENLRQVFLDYMSGLAGSMAKLDATRKFHDALQSIDKVNESETYEYASRYATDMLRNRDSFDNLLNSLKTMPYLWYISMNLRLAATQMFQNAITGYPILARIMQDLGAEGHASIELAKAMKDLAGNMTVQEQTMLQKAYNEGETMAQFIQEIKGDISRSWAGKYFTKFVDIVSYPFAGMERFNRKCSLLAAFRIALRVGQTEAEAYETAKEFVRSAHYAYGLNNFPQLLRDGTPFSKIMGLGYVFKSFPHNYVLSMIHYTRGKDGKLALGVLMRSLAMLTILGGLGAAPFIDDILDELERQTHYPARSLMRKSLERVGGPLLASAGMEGILALVGLDMSGSTKIQIPIPGVGEYDPGAIMMGVYGGLIDKGKNAISFAANNQWMRAVESAMPAGVESAIKSHRLITEGLRTATGKPILDEKGKPIRVTPYEVGVGLAGFRPARIAGIQKERRVAQNIKDSYAAKRKRIIQKMRLATTPEERRALSKDIQSYNLSVMKYEKIIPKIGVQSIKQAMKPERGYMEYTRLFED